MCCWMDWKLKLKCCAFAVASVALSLSVVYLHQQRQGDKKRRPRVTSLNESTVMAATSEVEVASHPVARLITSMEQLDVSQQPSESPQPPEEEIIDRDSANQSPSDFLSGNLHSDSHSEVSWRALKYFFSHDQEHIFLRAPTTAAKVVPTVPTPMETPMLHRVSM